MFKFFRKIKFKKDLLKNLEREAWRGDIDAAYLEASIPDLMKLIEAKQKEIKDLEAEIVKLENSFLRKDREQRKELEGKIEQKNNELKNGMQAIAQLRQQVGQRRQQAAQTRNFIEFIKKNF